MDETEGGFFANIAALETEEDKIDSRLERWRFRAFLYRHYGNSEESSHEHASAPHPSISHINHFGKDHKYFVTAV